jgi:molybdenum cofactor biosynthesis protein B
MNAAADRPPIRVLTVTVSDTRTRTNDETGKLLDDLLRAAGCVIVRHPIVKDEAQFIQELVHTVADDNEAETIILTGGTGIAERDRTHEALEAIFEKRMDGFGEAFRRLSWDEIGARSILSRATAGVVNGCVIYSLPGSPHAVRLGVEKLILPILQHAIDLAQGRTRHNRPSWTG